MLPIRQDRPSHTVVTNSPHISVAPTSSIDFLLISNLGLLGALLYDASCWNVAMAGGEGAW